MDTHYLQSAQPMESASSRSLISIGSFQLFRRWCSEHDVRSIPAPRWAVVRFARELSIKVSRDELRALLRAVRRTHLVVGFEDPTTGVLASLNTTVRRNALTAESSVVTSYSSTADDEREKVGTNG
jgi:hypothetical protein